MRMLDSCRAANCLLGLVSAPLQSLWVYSQLVKADSKVDANLAHIQPELLAESFRRELIEQARTRVDFRPIPKLTLEIATTDGSNIILCAPQTATVMNFLEAETIFVEWGHQQTFTEGAFALPEDHPLAMAATTDRGSPTAG